MPTQPTRQFRIERQYEPQHGEHGVLARAYDRLVLRHQRLPGSGDAPALMASGRKDRGQQEGRSHA